LHRLPVGNEARESNADSMSQDQLNEPDRLVRTPLSEFNCIDIIAVSLVASSPPSARCGAGSTNCCVNSMHCVDVLLGARRGVA
jgi:hypothetical protein